MSYFYFQTLLSIFYDSFKVQIFVESQGWSTIKTLVFLMPITDHILKICTNRFVFSEYSFHKFFIFYEQKINTKEYFFEIKYNTVIISGLFRTQEKSIFSAWRLRPHIEKCFLPNNSANGWLSYL